MGDEQEMKIKTPKIKTPKCSYGSVLQKLEKIDVGVKAGRISERRHGILSLKALKHCLRVK